MNSEQIFNLLLTKCPEVDKNKRYLKRYLGYIISCLKRNYNLSEIEYTEKHHICPVALFPKFKQFKKYNWNLAKLTAKQHYRAHYLLAKTYGGSMWNSINLMKRLVDQNETVSYSSNLRFEEIRRNLSAIQSERSISHWKNPIKRERHIQSMNDTWSEERRSTHSDLMKASWSDERKAKQAVDFTGDGNPFYNKTHTTETRAKIKEARVGYVSTEESNRKNSESHMGEKNHFYGKSHSNESLEKMKLALEALEPLICPFCNKTSKSRANMKRYHFDKCKFK